MAKINLFTTAKNIKNEAKELQEEFDQIDEELMKLGRFVFEKKKEISDQIKEQELQKAKQLEEEKIKNRALKAAEEEAKREQEEKLKQEKRDKEQQLEQQKKQLEEQKKAKEEKEQVKAVVEKKEQAKDTSERPVQKEQQTKPIRENNSNGFNDKRDNKKQLLQDKPKRKPVRQERKPSFSEKKTEQKSSYSNRKTEQKPAKPSALPVQKEETKAKVNRSHHSKDKHHEKKDKRWVASQEEKALLDKTRRRMNEKKNKQKNKYTKKTTKIIPERKKAITMGEYITVKELSEKIGIQTAQIIKKLMGLGIFATINQELDYETASLVASEFSIELEQKTVKSFEAKLTDEDVVEAEDDYLESRPPIVTVMGHVDHGKTSLLDAIRNSAVTEREAGGITQHIGAYTVKYNGNPITFLDTPGHEAFTSMRARGAQVTDIAILVVAANDGIMPQTIEAINHAKQADVPIIVAINKIDLEGANPERVKQELTEQGLVVEEWGGDTIAVPVSAIKKQGIDSLLEMITLVSEMQELQANPDRKARGTIIEAQLDKGRGPVATILVQKGTLKIGDSIVAGTAYGRVRAMMDHNGKRVKSAGPSVPVEVLGLSDVPSAGDVIVAVEDDKLAKQVADERSDKLKAEQVKRTSKVSLDDLFSKIKQGEIQDLNVIIKADVQGSVEAVSQAIEKLSNEEVRVKSIHGGVGGITESDIMLASASNAIIIGFNVRPSANASALAVKEEVDIHTYRIIYEVIEEIESAMRGMLAPEYKEVVLGQAEVRTLFKVSGVGVIAGSYVLNGKIQRNAKVRILRNDIVINESEMDSLKRFKDDAKEVASGYECGITIANFNDIKEGDIIEAYIMEEIKR